MLKFFPNSLRYKRPVGGVAVGASLYIRVEAAATEVTLVLTKSEEDPVAYPLQASGGGFEAELKITTRGLYYYHFLADGCRYGADPDLEAKQGEEAEWQLTVYEDDFFSGVKAGLIYQIMPDRFFSGAPRLKTRPNAVYRDDWYGTPEFRPDSGGRVKNNDFFGGNLKGITEKLAYIASLGATAVYLNPIFEAYSNHKYDTGNYRKIDADFGSEEDLKLMIARAKEYGIAVILDGVFSHTGDDSVYFNRCGRYRSLGAYQSASSPFYDWYRFSRFPDDYDCWWGIKTLPCVDENNAGYNEFINGVSGVADSWTSIGLGGWRLDVADELPDLFLENFRRAVKAANGSAVVIGEVWEDATTKIAYGRRRRYLLGGQLDGVVNYPLRTAIIDFVNGGEAAELRRCVDRLVNNYPPPALAATWNVLGTHDTERILTVLSGETRATKEERAAARIEDITAAMAKLRCAAVLQYTLPGTPCLYYGDEAGLEGYEDPFCRRCYPWGRENKQLLKFYRLLGRLRRTNAEALNGGIRFIEAKQGLLVFERRSPSQALTVAVNRALTAADLGFGGFDVLSKGEIIGRLAPMTAAVFTDIEKL